MVENLADAGSPTVKVDLTGGAERFLLQLQSFFPRTQPSSLVLTAWEFAKTHISEIREEMKKGHIKVLSLGEFRAAYHLATLNPAGPSRKIKWSVHLTMEPADRAYYRHTIAQFDHALFWETALRFFYREALKHQPRLD